MPYEKVFETLQDKGVNYLIAGGMAVNLHGVPRFTKDLDIVVDTAKANLKRLGEALRYLGYRPRIPVSLEEFLEKKNWAKWKREKGLRAFTVINPAQALEEIDILIGTPVSYSQASRRRYNLRMGDTQLPVVSLNDLIKMKRRASRKQDLSDIAALKKVQKIRRSL